MKAAFPDTDRRCKTCLSKDPCIIKYDGTWRCAACWLEEEKSSQEPKK